MTDALADVQRGNQHLSVCDAGEGSLLAIACTRFPILTTYPESLFDRLILSHLFSTPALLKGASKRELEFESENVANRWVGSIQSIESAGTGNIIGLLELVRERVTRLRTWPWVEVAYVGGVGLPAKAGEEGRLQPLKDGRQALDFLFWQVVGQHRAGAEKDHGDCNYNAR